MVTYKIGLRMRDGKSHVLKIEAEYPSNEAVVAAKQQAKDWAIGQYGQEPLVIVCSVENNSVEVVK